MIGRDGFTSAWPDSWGHDVVMARTNIRNTYVTELQPISAYRKTW